MQPVKQAGPTMYVDNPTPFDAQMNVALESSGREVVIVAVKGSFDLPAKSGGAAALSETQEPLFMGDVFGPDPESDATVFENDFAPFKPRCDVLCHGPALAPGGRPVSTLNVGLRLGGWSKAFSVNGPRIWLKGAAGYHVSDIRPFARLDIGYDQAWGGVDPDPDSPGRAATCQENPSGVGYYPYLPDREGAPLPQTSEIGRIIQDTSGPHRPMAFGPLGRHWLPRRTHSGTYDEDWAEHRAPIPPEDLNPLYFQAAPPDQQIAYPKGGEPIEIMNMVEEGRLGTYLPRDRITISFLRKNGPVSQKIGLLDTVLVLPEMRKICLTWRSRFRTERDLHEVDEILIRHDPAGGANG